MIALNLTTSNMAETVLKDYLEQSVTQDLARKINEGAPFEKDGKKLVNKKTLAGFLEYAKEEARKQAEVGAQSACLGQDVVFGWANHYFEEDSIVEKLYTEDGEEYKPAPKPSPKATAKPIELPKPKPPAQRSIFELLEEQPQEEEPRKEAPVEKPKMPGFYIEHKKYVDQYPGCIVAYRVGDFYEIFNDDAIAIAKALDLTLSSRDVGLEARVPMVGFPFHMADDYIPKLFKIKPVVMADNEGARVFEEPIEQTLENVDLETGEVLNQTALFDDDSFIELLRVLGDVEVRL